MTMRKMLALAMMALLALTIAFALLGCGKKSEDETSTTETTPPVETSMPDTGAMMGDTTVMDTLHH